MEGLVLLHGEVRDALGWRRHEWDDDLEQNLVHAFAHNRLVSPSVRRFAHDLCGGRRVFIYVQGEKRRVGCLIGVRIHSNVE